MKRNDKQRLFEVMGRLDKTFKPRLNEEFETNNEDYISPEVIKKIWEFLGDVEVNYETKNPQTIARALYNDYKIQDVSYNTLYNYIKDHYQKEKEQSLKDYPKSDYYSQIPFDAFDTERVRYNDMGEYLGTY